jgi:RimJ/RimL family protein N-acetyltransferase
MLEDANPFLVGKRLSLNALKPSALDVNGGYYRWLDDLSLDLYSERSYFPNSPQRMEEYYTLSVQRKLLLLGIFDKVSGNHVGNITLQELDWVNRRGFIGYLIGEKDFAGRGIASEACLMLLYYGFNKLNLDRIWTTVSVDHAASLKVAEKAGFKVEGRLREHQMRNGRRSDLIIVGALRQEWMTERGDAARDAYATLPV